MFYFCLYSCFARALALHITTKRIPMLQQLREGLEIYDLIKVMQKKPQECNDLFVIGYDDKVCRNSVLSILGFFYLFCHKLQMLKYIFMLFFLVFRLTPITFYPTWPQRWAQLVRLNKWKSQKSWNSFKISYLNLKVWT